ncbi:beta family protein [Neorhizobium sp. NCHU2750]|nr:hypothetical protein NCHU2750_51990 [Neorhizobium sp. NCHU2750]
MFPRELSEVDYVPLLSVRPAEIRALKELPEKTKDRLLPFMFLRPWTTAQQLDNALVRIEEAYGARPVIIDAGSNEPIEGQPRPVHQQLAELRNPTDGYRNWFEFLEAREHYIPSLQLANLVELPTQLARLATLERGLVIRLPQQAFGQSVNIAQSVSQHFSEDEVCFVIDYEQASSELLTRAAAANGISIAIMGVMPNAAIALSATSFPSDFVGRVSQEIYERQFHRLVSDLHPERAFIYSDRGSARAERQLGGGGTPAPRVDLAVASQWEFYREEDQGDRDQAYFDAATRATESSAWDPLLKVWGTQMIERTANEDDDAIVSPARSTAVRINLHLHEQSYYGAPPSEKYDTDEDWTDF